MEDPSAKELVGLKMEGKVVILLLCALALAMLAKAAPQPEEHEASSLKPTDSKLFNFAQYKEIFNKHYISTIEELSRCRIFLANAFKVFLNWIKYNKRDETSFQKLNDMSDWTRGEISGLYSYKGVSGSGSKESVIEADEGLDLETIEERLDEVKLKEDTSLMYAKVIEDLNEPGVIEHLMPSKEEVEKTREPAVLRVESNNPDYIAPDLVTMGADDDEEAQPPARVNRWVEPIVDLETIFSSGMTAATDIGGWIRNVFFAHNQLETFEDASDDFLIPGPDRVYVDHSATCTALPRSQGHCGSCYIFSVIALLEWEYCKRYDILMEFSEQFPLDCGVRTNLKGCNGGQETHVLNFIREYGLELRENYPYMRKQEECPYPAEIEPKRMGYLKVYDLDYRTVKLSYLAQLIQHKPVLVGVFVGDEFLQYGGGVHSGNDCNKSRGHAMLLVGHGIEKGREYWLFKNSHGYKWGEKGYYKLDKTTGAKCLMDGVGWILANAFSAEHREIVNPVYYAHPVSQRCANNTDSFQW